MFFYLTKCNNMFVFRELISPRMFIDCHNNLLIYDKFHVKNVRYAFDRGDKIIIVMLNCTIIIMRGRYSLTMCNERGLSIEYNRYIVVPFTDAKFATSYYVIYDKFSGRFELSDEMLIPNESISFKTDRYSELMLRPNNYYVRMPNGIYGIYEYAANEKFEDLVVYNNEIFYGNSLYINTGGQQFIVYKKIERILHCEDKFLIVAQNDGTVFKICRKSLNIARIPCKWCDARWPTYFISCARDYTDVSFILS